MSSTDGFAREWYPLRNLADVNELPPDHRALLGLNLQRLSAEQQGRYLRRVGSVSRRVCSDLDSMMQGLTHAPAERQSRGLCSTAELDAKRDAMLASSRGFAPASTSVSAVSLDHGALNASTRSADGPARLSMSARKLGVPQSLNASTTSLGVSANLNASMKSVKSAKSFNTSMRSTAASSRSSPRRADVTLTGMLEKVRGLPPVERLRHALVMVCGSVDGVYEQIDPGGKGIVTKENFLILLGMLGIPPEQVTGINKHDLWRLLDTDKKGVVPIMDLVGFNTTGQAGVPDVELMWREWSNSTGLLPTKMTREARWKGDSIQEELQMQKSVRDKEADGVWRRKWMRELMRRGERRREVVARHLPKSLDAVSLAQTKQGDATKTAALAYRVGREVRKCESRRLDQEASRKDMASLVAGHKSMPKLDAY